MFKVGWNPRIQQLCWICAETAVCQVTGKCRSVFGQVGGKNACLAEKRDGHFTRIQKRGCKYDTTLKIAFII